MSKQQLMVADRFVKRLGWEMVTLMEWLVVARVAKESRTGMLILIGME